MREIPSDVLTYNRQVTGTLRHIFTPICEKLQETVNTITTAEFEQYLAESLVALVDYQASKYDSYTQLPPVAKFLSLNNQGVSAPENIPAYFDSFLKHLNESALNKPYNLASFLTGTFAQYLWSPLYQGLSEANNHAAETLVIPVGDYGIDEALLMLFTSYVLCRTTDRLVAHAQKIEAEEWRTLSEETASGRKKAENIRQGLSTEIIPVLDAFKEGIQSVQATLSSLTAKKVGQVNFEVLLEKIVDEKFLQKIATKVPFNYTLPSIRQGIFHEGIFENKLSEDDSLKLSPAFLGYCKETQMLYQQSRVFVHGQRNPGVLGLGCPLAQKEKDFKFVGIHYIAQAYLETYKKLKQMIDLESIKAMLFTVQFEKPLEALNKKERPDESIVYNVDEEKSLVAREKLQELTDFHRLTRDVLLFWFEQLPLENLPSKAIRQKWFCGGVQFDEVVREKFAYFIETVSNGGFLNLRRTPTETVALIILLDQLSRNAFRGTPKAFAQDELALELAKELVDSGKDKTLPLPARWFVYMPYQHSESFDVQKESVRLFGELCGSAESAEEKEVFANTLAYANEHKETIELFGRFPYRNEAMGRETTADERLYLSKKDKGSTITHNLTYGSNKLRNVIGEIFAGLFLFLQSGKLKIIGFLLLMCGMFKMAVKNNSCFSHTYPKVGLFAKKSEKLGEKSLGYLNSDRIELSFK